MRGARRAAALAAFLAVLLALCSARPTIAAGASRSLLKLSLIKETPEGLKQTGGAEAIAEHQKVVEKEISAVRLRRRYAGLASR